MTKRLAVLLVCVLLVTGLLVGCGNQSKVINNGEIDENKDIQLGELDFESIDESSLKEDTLKNWFEINYKNNGISTIKHNENVYILIGAGEQNTGGYSVEVTSVVGKQNEIIVSGRLNSPKESEMVIQALTYPNAIVKIPKDDRIIMLGSFEYPDKDGKHLSSGVMEGDGIYVGQADSNFIEIIVEGHPQEFMISEDIKDYFDVNSYSYKDLRENDEVHFTYREDESTGNSVIIGIYKNNDINKGENAIIGKYIGQIDSNSIEVEVNDVIGAYRLSEEAKTILLNGTIKDGDSVYIEYETNEYGQLIILNIKKNPQN